MEADRDEEEDVEKDGGENEQGAEELDKDQNGEENNGEPETAEEKEGGEEAEKDDSADKDEEEKDEERERESGREEDTKTSSNEKGHEPKVCMFKNKYTNAWREQWYWLMWLCFFKKKIRI